MRNGSLHDQQQFDRMKSQIDKNSKRGSARERERERNENYYCCYFLLYIFIEYGIQIKYRKQNRFNLRIETIATKKI